MCSDRPKQTQTLEFYQNQRARFDPIEGVPVQLVDTAGIRETEDAIERMGIEKSKNEVNSANIKLLMIDTSTEMDYNDFTDENKGKLHEAIIIANKVDIRHPNWDKEKLIRLWDKNLNICEISCKTKQGLDELLQLISQKLLHQDLASDFVLLEARNTYHFTTIQNCLNTTLDLIHNNAPPEIYIKEIDAALDEIAMINGKVETEEILGRIFSKFCVGK